MGLDYVSLRSYCWGVVFLFFHFGSLITGSAVWFMGVYSLLLGLFQLFNYGFFVKAIQNYDFIASRNLFYARLYPFLELFAGLLFVLSGLFVFFGVLLDFSGLFVQVGALFVLVFSFTSFVGVSKVLIRRRRVKRRVSCACFGGLLNLPVSFVTFIELGLMINMAFLHLFTII